MTCPVCFSKTIIVGSKSDSESVHRRRMCVRCKHIFYTEEYDSKSSEQYDALMNQYCQKKRKDNKHHD